MVGVSSSVDKRYIHTYSYSCAGPHYIYQWSKNMKMIGGGPEALWPSLVHFFNSKLHNIIII